MGLGGYLAGRPEVEHCAAELAPENEEVQTMPDGERREVKELLAEMGLSPATQEVAVRELTADPEQCVKLMMKHELGLEEPDARQAPQSAVTISGAYAVGGLNLLSAYFLTSTPQRGLLWRERPGNWPARRLLTAHESNGFLQCRSCAHVWALSSPNHAWRGYFLPEALAHV